jgi:hypothetical protein
MLGAGGWYFPTPILIAATSSKGRHAVWAASMSFPIAPIGLARHVGATARAISLASLGAPDFLSQITKARPLSISAEPSATLGREAMRIIAKTDPFVRVRL